MSDGSQYDADYFLRGRQSGKSLYEDYRWMPNLTRRMVESIVDHLGIDHNDIILDFGCARGYVVRAFRELGYTAYGYDVSRWAVDNADPAVHHYLTTRPELAFSSDVEYDWIVAKDVLEHVEDLKETIRRLKNMAQKGIFAVVPLAHGDQYDVPEYEKDVTHIHRRPLDWWVSMFSDRRWLVEGCYRVRGVKDNYAHYPTGNGFIVARRSMQCQSTRSRLARPARQHTATG